MQKKLVIVESPTKAKTITRFLGKDFIVKASMGHVRDLPSSAGQIPAKLKKEAWARLGVDVDNDFQPLYVVSADRKKHIAELKKDLKDASELWLATDEDREGESISWHLVELLKPKVPQKRLVFHEITKNAIQAAFDNARPLDTRLVKAQETRRILDRLFGYEVSPILWKKVATGLSAGRVQSVATKLLVDRELARMAFHSGTYWRLTATLQATDGVFDAQCVDIGSRKIATGRDFDAATGKLSAKAAGNLLLGEAMATSLAAELATTTMNVATVETKPYTRRPGAPFITSTLQQEGGRKLRWNAKRTMRTAQALYENGYITYMRTDSTTLSNEALGAARSAVQTMYGADHLSPSPRQFSSKVKNAQEAHEAIRPAGDRFHTPQELATTLSSDERKLYDMIWKRTVASQMADARGEQVALRVEAPSTQGIVGFHASGRTITFAGFLRAYVEGSDDPEAELADKETLLPSVAPGQGLQTQSVSPTDHSTQPPARYTEASLIKDLEANGIGRPSTYASIIDTIERRDYTFKKGNTLVPTFTAFAVSRLLAEHFPDLVDASYTARMEDDLDAIARGELEQLDYLKKFYFGNGATGFHKLLAETVDAIDARGVCTIRLGHNAEDEAVSVRLGRYGPYIECGENRASLPEGLGPDEVTLAYATELLEKTSAGPKELGLHPETGLSVTLRTGRYGPYVQLGEAEGKDKPKNVSLMPGMDPETLSLEQALQLLSLPRELGANADGAPIVAHYGRYGSYIKCGRETRSLEATDNLFTLSLERALALLATEKRSSFSRKPVELAVVGTPEGSDVPLKVLKGRFGPYVTDGEVNASLPKGASVEGLTLERALELLAARRERITANGGKPKRKKKTTKKKTTKKKAAKKSSAKKTAKKKTATKKAAKTVAKKKTTTEEQDG